MPKAISAATVDTTEVALQETLRGTQATDLEDNATYKPAESTALAAA